MDFPGSKEINFIGVFDSGVGGLTVFKELTKALPDKRMIYLGDTARVPYGIKSKETIIRYSREAVQFFIKKGVDFIVVACNTSSALAIEALKGQFDLPIVGVIEPGARKACALTGLERIGVIGTQATVKSDAYAQEIKKLLPGARVTSFACPLFVPLVEEGWTENKVAWDIAFIYLEKLQKEAIDVLILGCTHYPLLKNTIAGVIGESVKLVDSAEAVAQEVGRLLQQQMSDALKKSNKEKPFSKAPYQFFVTDSADKFKEVSSRFLGYEIDNPEIVDITED
jgi:glutamate racemase